MKLRNIFTFAILSILFASSINGQGRLGIKVEYGIQNLQTAQNYLISGENKVDHQISLLNTTPSQSIGLYSAFDFGYIFLQPEVLYTQYSVNYNIENFNTSRDVPKNMTVTEKIQQFDIPVYAGVRYKFLKFGAGPVFHIGENIQSDFSNLETMKVSATKISAGLQAGIGIDLKYVNLDVKYQRDFNNVSDHLEYNGQPTGLKSSLSGLKIGHST
ncbi:PorT family protein [Saprospiraceae bacterium]|nr:PorT family protein [Saprospiraceae bacterium]